MATVFLFDGDSNDGNWKNSESSDWELSHLELSGSETVLGHKNIDGAILKVLQCEYGIIAALLK